MADTQTPNHGFTQPEVGASKDSWGTKLNDNWFEIDALLGTTGDPNDPGLFLPLTGGITTGSVTVTGGLVKVDRTGEVAGGFMTIDADPGQTQAFRFTDDTATSRNIIRHAKGTPTLTIGNTVFDAMEYEANSSGRHNFYCGTANLDAAIDSNGFYMFGSTGLAATGPVYADASIDQGTLTITPKVSMGHGGNNAYIANEGAGNIELRIGSTGAVSAVAKFTPSSGAEIDGPITSDGNIIVERTGQANAAYMDVRADGGVTSGLRIQNQAGDSNRNTITRPASTDNLTIGNTGWVDLNVIASSGGQISLFCGNANIDASVNSSRFRVYSAGTTFFDANAGVTTHTNAAAGTVELAGANAALYAKQGSNANSGIVIHDNTSTVRARLSAADMADNTSASSAQSLIRRAAGDARYAQTAALVQLLNTLVTNGALTQPEADAVAALATP